MLNTICPPWLLIKARDIPFLFRQRSGSPDSPQNAKGKPPRLAFWCGSSSVTKWLFLCAAELTGILHCTGCTLGTAGSCWWGVQRPPCAAGAGHWLRRAGTGGGRAAHARSGAAAAGSASQRGGPGAAGPAGLGRTGGARPPSPASSHLAGAGFYFIPIIVNSSGYFEKQVT